MNIIFLLIVALTSCVKLSAQIDSFYVGSTKFKIRCPEEWNLIDIKDTASPLGGNNNALFRFAAFDDCNYSLIGIQIVDRNLQPIGKEKKYRKNKKQESFTEFRTVSGFQCYYFRAEEANKQKCNNQKISSAYLHRINDTLDLIIYLNCAVLISDSPAMEAKLLSVTETFLADNQAEIYSLKPHLTFSPVPDSVQILGHHLHFTTPPRWQVTKRTKENAEDPTGKRIIMTPMKDDSETPAPSLSIVVQEFDPKSCSSTLFYFDFQMMEMKKSPLTRSKERIDSIGALVDINGYDTLSWQDINVTVLKYQEKTIISYSQHFSFVVRGGSELYVIEFIMTSTADDALQLQYCTEQFAFVCKYVITHNNFLTWK